MRLLSFVLCTCLLPLLVGCPGKRYGKESVAVRDVLVGRWSNNAKDEGIDLDFADDGGMKLSFDVQPVSEDGKQAVQRTAQTTGTYKLDGDHTLQLDFKMPAKVRPARKVPGPGSYKVEAERWRHQGIDKDKGGPHFRDWQELRLILTDAKGAVWELSREK